METLKIDGDALAKIISNDIASCRAMGAESSRFSIAVTKGFVIELQISRLDFYCDENNCDPDEALPDPSVADAVSVVKQQDADQTSLGV